MTHSDSLAEPRSLPVALTVAGSDNSAGAGVQADLKTFGAHGVYGLTALTCVVAEVPGVVSAIQPVETSVVVEQIRLALQAFPVAAIKTGMLYSQEIISAVCEALSVSTGSVPIVVDPVMIASSGDLLLKSDAVEACRTLLFPLAAVVTPNADELAALAERPIRSHDDLRDAACAMADRFNVPFLAKGGHLKGDLASDYLVRPGGVIREFSAPFIKGISPHGTGCTYSSAIAARLAVGKTLDDAVNGAKDYITRAIRHHLAWPAQARDGNACETTVCLNHFV